MAPEIASIATAETEPVDPRGPRLFHGPMSAARAGLGRTVAIRIGRTNAPRRRRAESERNARIEGSTGLPDFPRQEIDRFPRKNTLLQRKTAREAFVVTVEVLERGLREFPAVVAGARVEVHEPQALDHGAESQDLAGPLPHDSLALVLALASGLSHPDVVEHRFRSDLLHLRQDLARLFESEDARLCRSARDELRAFGRKCLLADDV